MVVILALPLHSIFRQRDLGSPLPLPLCSLQLIIEVPGEFKLRLPLLDLDIPRLVRRSRIHLNVFLDLEDVLEAGIEVEQEQDQLVQQFKRVVRRDQNRPVSVLLKGSIGRRFVHSFGCGRLCMDELKLEFEMFRSPERNGEDEDVRDLQTERIGRRVRRNRVFTGCSKPL